MNEQTIAIVIGQGGYNDMGLIRSCGEAGMYVIAIIPQATVMPLHKSKYVKECIRESIADIETLFKVVCRISKNHPKQRIVLFPASDLSACLMDDAWESLSEFALTPNAGGRLRELMDKYTMGEIAMKSSLLVPRSIKVNLEVNRDPCFNLPCIIKPLRSIFGEKGDICICRTKSEYNKTLSLYHEKGFYEILLQELIEGKDIEEVAVTGVCTHDKQIITQGIIHKIRIRGNGSTVFARFCTDIDPTLQHNICAFIKTTGYTGIFDIEFLKNDYGYHFIECNFRNGAYGYAVTSAGFNMPLLFASDNENGIPQLTKLKNVTFMEERSDILNMLDGTVSLLRWIKDILSTDTFLWWNRRDPKPVLRVPTFIKRLYCKK